MAGSLLTGHRDDALAMFRLSRNEAHIQGTIFMTEAVETAPAAVVPTWTPVEQNGVKQYRPGSVGANVWAISDAITARKGDWAAAAEVIAEGTTAGVNEGSCRAGYATWRKFNGLAGHRIDNPEKAAKKAADDAAKAAKEAEKVAAAQAKADEKAAKAAAKEAEKATKAEAKAAKAAEAAAAKEAAAAEKAAAQAAAAAETPPAPPAE